MFPLKNLARKGLRTVFVHLLCGIIITTPSLAMLDISTCYSFQAITDSKRSLLWEGGDGYLVPLLS